MRMVLILKYIKKIQNYSFNFRLVLKISNQYKRKILNINTY